jgi:hypothetical protein
MSDRTPRTISQSSSSESVPNGAPPVQEQQADAIHDVPPGGLWPSQSELPVVAVLGGPPATLGGYSPDPGQAPQVSNLEDPLGLSYLKCPEGLRR